MKFASSLILLLCAPLLSMEENNKIVPKSLDPNLWINTLKMLGNFGNLSQTNSKWNQFCKENFDVLYNHYISSFVEINPNYKYGMVQGPFPGLMMVLKPMSKFIGVNYNENQAAWRAMRYSRHENKEVYNGDCKDEETAAHASDTVARKFIASGEKGHKLNFPGDDTEVYPKPLNKQEEKLPSVLYGPNDEGCILDLGKTVVSFRFQDRDFALKKINPNMRGQSIDFVYKPIGKGIQNTIHIQYRILKLPMKGKFSAPQAHFILDFPPMITPMMAVNIVYFNQSPHNFVDVTKSFMDADVQPRFAPEFAQTLLKQQKFEYLQ